MHFFLLLICMITFAQKIKQLLHCIVKLEKTSGGKVTQVWKKYVHMPICYEALDVLF
jgi:hypothetical protein